MSASALPAAPGTYLLVLRADAPARVSVGSLGELEVGSGYYLYAGSALGPGAFPKFFAVMAPAVCIPGSAGTGCVPKATWSWGS